MDNNEDDFQNPDQNQEEEKKQQGPSAQDAYDFYKKAKGITGPGGAGTGAGGAATGAETAAAGAAGAQGAAGATAGGAAAGTGAAAGGAASAGAGAGAAAGGAAAGAAGSAAAGGTAAAGTAVAATPVGWIAIGIGIAIALIFIIIFFFRSSTGGAISDDQSTGTGGTGINAGGPATSSQCTYYGRSGGLKIGSQKLADLINEISSKTGIPPSVLFGIVRIETPGGFTMTDSSFFENDFDATVSFAGAVGFAQFLPGTFTGVYFSNQEELKNSFGKTDVDVSTNQSSDTTKLRITSIKDSLTAAAFKIRADKISNSGSDSPWDENAVKYVARRYQGACLYDDGAISGDYCEDLWKSVSSCQSPAAPVVANSCPITGGVVTCGSEFTPDRNGCGHCSPAYIRDWDKGGWCAKDAGVHYAMDIGAAAGQEVYLPKINDHIIQWTLSYEEPRPSDLQAIYGYTGEDKTTGDKYYAQYHHVEIGSQNPGTHESGELAAKVCTSCNPGNYHLHLQLGSGGVGPGGTQWIDAPLYFCKQ